MASLNSMAIRGYSDDPINSLRNGRRCARVRRRRRRSRGYHTRHSPGQTRAAHQRGWNACADLSNFIATHPDSALAELSRHGVTYTNNSTSSPSDSFPGLASLVTGGSPVTTGLWYDDTYNRALSPPAQTDGLGNPGGACPGQIGTNVAWDEAVDMDLTQTRWRRRPESEIPGAQSGQGLQDHPAARISAREYDFRSGESGRRTHCVDRQASLPTNGPTARAAKASMTSRVPKSIRFRSRCRSLPGCSPVPFADPTPDDGWTNSFDDIKCYDSAACASRAQSDRRLHPRSRAQGRCTGAIRHQFPGRQRRRETGHRSGDRFKGGYTDVLGHAGAGAGGRARFHRPIDRPLRAAN